MIFLIIAMIALTSAITLAAREAVVKRALKKKEQQVKEIDSPKEVKPSLSIPGENLQLLFDELPDTHRPDVDIYDICRALDVKFKNTDLNNHFRKYEDNGWDYGWYWAGWHKCACTREEEPPTACPFQEYIDPSDQMNELITAVQEQDRVLELAEHEAGLSEARLLMSALDDSVHVVRSVTAEVSARVESN